jgi:hypothetical protein
MAVPDFLDMSDGVKIPAQSPFGSGKIVRIERPVELTEDGKQVLVSAALRFGASSARQIGQALGLIPYDAPVPHSQTLKSGARNKRTGKLEGKNSVNTEEL